MPPSENPPPNLRPYCYPRWSNRRQPSPSREQILRESASGKNMEPFHTRFAWGQACITNRYDPEENTALRRGAPKINSPFSVSEASNISLEANTMVAETMSSSPTPRRPVKQPHPPVRDEPPPPRRLLRQLGCEDARKSSTAKQKHPGPECDFIPVRSGD